MALRLGSTAISGAYVGSDPVARIYLGSDLIWAATPSITGNGSGTVDITIDDGTFSVTVSGSDYVHQNGTFGPFDTSDLDSGPVLVVAPVISGTAGTGQTLTAAPGIWVHEAGDAPTITGQWRRDGVAISGETGSTYTTTAADEGTDVEYRETATNAAGARSADSDDIAIPVGTGWNVSDNGDGTFDITSAPSTPAALIATDNGDGTFNLEAA